MDPALKKDIRRTVWKRIRTLLMLIGGVLFGGLLLVITMGLLIDLYHNRPAVVNRNATYYKSLGYGPNQSRCLAIGELRSQACLQALVGPPQAHN